MPEQRHLSLPRDAYRLEHVNLPAPLAKLLAGQTITVHVFPEEAAGTRRVGPNDCPVLIDPDGNCWNDWRPVRVQFTDPESRIWRLPRRWLPGFPVSSEPPLEEFYEVFREIVFTETLNPPTAWDLWAINVPWEQAQKAYGHGPWTVEVHLSPGGPVKVCWRSRDGTVWRLPHHWRRRRVKLPQFPILASQGIPDDIAEAYAGKIVSVNYHPGSLCCLPDQYRFRDAEGRRWPVWIRDCVLMGLGDVEESRA